MDTNLKFTYEKEYWYISAIINTNFIKCDQKAKEIETLVQEKAKNLKDIDLSKISWNKEWVEQTKELGKNMSVKCSWIPFIESFPYDDENIGLKYNTLGYFEFEIEYYPNQPEKKGKIDPILIQQIPVIILEELKVFRQKIDNKYLNIDLYSPIYIFATSKKINLKNIQWNSENINKFKKVLSYWTEIYSGQWPDYSNELYQWRVKNNLSNRLSELHYIRRNSGFIYMNKENYNQFFDSYMKKYVITPTAQIRAILYALISINESLDTLFVMHNFMDIDIIKKKIENLRFLRGIMQTQMSIIYNELDYNRRHHYTRVLTHLISEFQINRLLERINRKFDILQDSMQSVYQKQNEENQKKTQRVMKILNLLVGIGILSDITVAIDGVIKALNEGFLPMFLLQIVISISLSIVLIITAIYFLKIKITETKSKIRKTVDAILFDKSKEKIVLVKRKFPPCKGQYAFPGGYIELGESPEEALIREVKEETGLNISICKKVGVYDKPGRDPRGLLITTAYICIISDDISHIMCSEESTSVELIPIEELEKIDLAFDHEDILKDAIKLIKKEKIFS
ncbi:MAG: NUDIX domain-containing protein [Candidatus Helarchaeota archaeon]